MDKLTTTLLTSAAMAGLAAAPAMAAGHMPAGNHVPRVALKTAKGIITMSGVPHVKTNINKGIGRPTTFTSTYTYYQYTYSFAASTIYKTPVDLPAFAFYTVSSGGHCVDYQPQKAKAVATGGLGNKAAVYTVKSHVTIGSCTGTLTFFGPAYTLKNKATTFEQVQLNDKLTFKSSYTTTTTTTTTGVKHKMKKHKHKHKYRDNFTGREVVNLHIH